MGAEKLAFSVAEAAYATGVSAALIRQAIKDNELVARYAKTKTIIATTDLERWLSALPTEPRA
jgi:hypothetical protein